MGDPWFKFFPSDWLSGVSGLSAGERGVYVTLLAMMYDHGGPIKRDDGRLSRQCGLPKVGFSRALEALIALGKITESDGTLFASLMTEWQSPPSRRIPKYVCSEVIDRDGERCVYCGDEIGPFHFDHVFPWSKGGGHSADNIVVACKSCNLSKGSLLLSEWFQ